jgi:protein-S-isoprenylcysteine O-methyltransferase Ste14
MYLGWALLHLGAGVAGDSAWVVATWPAVVGLVHREVMREEQNLSDEFEEGYGRYRAAVPRYLPGWRALPGRYSHAAG